MSLQVGARLLQVRMQPGFTRHAIQRRISPVGAISHRVPLSRGYIHTETSIKTRRCMPYPNNAQRRTASTSSASEPSPLSDPLNPPASTRPPPLELPVRDPDTNLFTYLFRLGKAYTTFYKTGLKAVFTNRRLLRDLPDTTPPKIATSETSKLGSPEGTAVAATPESSLSSLNKAASPTRAVLLLRARVRHDTARLPLFGLVMLICGEFTPLVVVTFPNLTPYTCRIPTQTAVIRRKIEARRAASFRALSYVQSDGSSNGAAFSSGGQEVSAALVQVADGHICRSLGLGGKLWDRMGFDVPFAKARAADAVRRIVQDDALIRKGEGVSALVDDEVVLACEERGMDTFEKDVDSLRRRLEAWIKKSAPSQTSNVEAALNESSDKVTRLLLRLDEL